MIRNNGVGVLACLSSFLGNFIAFEAELIIVCISVDKAD